MEKVKDWVNSTGLLLYGELDELLFKKMIIVLEMKRDKVLSDGEDLEEVTALEYWLIMSELERADFFEYGTSPRGGWLTDEGEAFLNELKSMTLKEFLEIED